MRKVALTSIFFIICFCILAFIFVSFLNSVTGPLSNFILDTMYPKGYLMGDEKGWDGLGAFLIFAVELSFLFSVIATRLLYLKLSRIRPRFKKETCIYIVVLIMALLPMVLLRLALQDSIKNYSENIKLSDAYFSQIPTYEFQNCHEVRVYTDIEGNPADSKNNISAKYPLVGFECSVDITQDINPPSLKYELRAGSDSQVFAKKDNGELIKGATGLLSIIYFKEKQSSFQRMNFYSPFSLKKGSYIFQFLDTPSVISGNISKAGKNDPIFLVANKLKLMIVYKFGARDEGLSDPWKNEKVLIESKTPVETQPKISSKIGD